MIVFTVTVPAPFVTDTVRYAKPPNANSLTMFVSAGAGRPLAKVFRRWTFDCQADTLPMRPQRAICRGISDSTRKAMFEMIPCTRAGRNAVLMRSAKRLTNRLRKSVFASNRSN